MVKPLSRTLLSSVRRPTLLATTRNGRFISTAPAHLKSRSWKSSALRWGIAVAGIYYYNTSPVFAEHPQHNLLNPNVEALEDEHSSATLDALTASSRHKTRKDASILQSAVESASEKAVGAEVANRTTELDADLPTTDASPAELEEEAESQGAFNPVTGEINWDCPCLGGMAHGPCGPEFREAFSCFVYSTEEPKGMNCIDKFQNMQNCFREHPDVYKGELEDDEELDAELAQEREELTNQIAERKAAEKAQQAEGGDGASSKSAPATSQSRRASTKIRPSSEPHSGLSDDHESVAEGQRSSVNRQHNLNSIGAGSAVEDGEFIPKAAHDASDAGTPKSKGK